MKILLLNPPMLGGGKYVKVHRCMQKVDAWGSLWPPVSLCYIQAVLGDSHETKLIDGMALDLTLDKMVKEIEEYSPDLVIINTSFPTIHNDNRISKIIKEKFGCYTAVIGQPPTFIPEECKGFDIVVKGEPELAILDVVEDLGSNKKKRIYQKDFMDMDNLPAMELKDIPLDKYTMSFSKNRLMPIETARGCPYKCTYCTSPPYFGQKIRYKSPKLVVDEIEMLNHKYRIKDFLFWSDTYTANKKVVFETCDEIKKRGLDINWLSVNRVDTVNKEILSKMKKAGCSMSSFGVESGSQEILDNIKKGTKVKQAEDAIKACREVGIWSMAHLIFGLPGETWQSYNHTIRWIKKVGPDYIQAYCATPYPGTELRELAERKKWILSNNYSTYEISNAVMRNDELSASEIKGMREQAYLRFYLTPKFFAREVFRHPSIYTIFDGLRFMKNWVLTKN